MKILVLAGDTRSLVNFRGALITEMVRLGHEVVASAPPESVAAEEQLKAIGARFVPIGLARAGLNPLADLRSWRRMVALFRRERPDLVLSYTIKPVIYGTLAAQWTGVPRIYGLITGLGAAFFTNGAKGKLLSVLASRLYRWALPYCRRVMVQNREIAEILTQRKILDAEDRLVVVPGSGVDTRQFAAMPFPGGPPCFLLLGRLLKDKGIVEYVTAAREVRRQLPSARFLLVGDFDPNPAAISAKQLKEWTREGVIEHQFFRTDVRALLAQCTAYVLPSYHEGMPRSVLEAMATGRAVVTTDVIGCRATVFGVDYRKSPPTAWRLGENGLLVPVRSSEALAAALVHLGRNPDLAETMGRRGRELAETHFDVRKINALMLETMQLTGPAVRP